MVAAVTPEPMDTSVYNGPYITGEEYQELLNTEARMDALWKIPQEDIED
jgi:hypothetical protein